MARLARAPSSANVLVGDGSLIALPSCWCLQSRHGF